MRLALAAVACALAVVPAADAWVLQGKPWPVREVTVWNSTGYAAAVHDAIRAWNGVGAGIRLAAAPSRSSADVVVRYGAGGSRGEATVGFGPGQGRVALSRGLSRTLAATIATHELGHVLGLGHQKGCVVMAPVLNVGSGTRCGIAACKTLWRCLVLPDDAAGLRSLYGRARG